MALPGRPRCSVSDGINKFTDDQLSTGDVDILETEVGSDTYLVLSVPFLERPFPDALTESERAVAEMAIRGWTNKEIAEERGTSDRTIANQVRAIFAKCGVASRSELIQKYT
jgi:DNA-binding NarL/FixJ family response regulator